MAVSKSLAKARGHTTISQFSAELSLSLLLVCFFATLSRGPLQNPLLPSFAPFLAPPASGQLARAFRKSETLLSTQRLRPLGEAQAFSLSEGVTFHLPHQLTWNLAGGGGPFSVSREKPAAGFHVDGRGIGNAPDIIVLGPKARDGSPNGPTGSLKDQECKSVDHGTVWQLKPRNPKSMLPSLWT